MATDETLSLFAEISVQDETIKHNIVVSENLPKHHKMSSNLAAYTPYKFSPGDPSEAALLRSRIDEQSELIMILKQRSDEAVSSQRLAEHIKDELKQSYQVLEEELNSFRSRNEILDRRFSDLASNHQEMIKFKDEYKRRNIELMAENSELRLDNSRLFSATIEEKNRLIKDLELSTKDMKQEISSLSQQLISSQSKSAESNAKYSKALREIKLILKNTEEKLAEVNSEYERLKAERSSTDSESQVIVSKLTREKDELLALTISRGKLVQEKQGDIRKLQQQITDMEKEIKIKQEQMERTLAAASVNQQVLKLNQSIADMQAKHDATLMDFEAFKKHSQTLLQKEKDLNSRLRHLVE